MLLNALKTAIVYVLLIANGFVVAQTNGVTSKSDKRVEELLDKANKSIHADSNKAIGYLNEALKYKSEISEKQLLFLYKIATVIYTYDQSNIAALDYGYKSLALQKKIDPSRTHFIYNNIACVYMQLGDTKKSRIFLNKSLEGLKQSLKAGKLKEKDVEAYLVYSNLAAIEIEEKNYPKALEMLHIYEKH